MTTSSCMWTGYHPSVPTQLVDWTPMKHRTGQPGEPFLSEIRWVTGIESDALRVTPTLVDSAERPRGGGLNQTCGALEQSTACLGA
jgi:hypothetical protein